MSELEILGLIASGFTMASFMPQIWRTWKTRDVSGMSLTTYIIMTIGVSLWLVYGILKGDLPLIITNATLVMLSSSLSVMIVIFDKR